MNNDLISADAGLSGIYRGQLFQKGSDIHVYIPGLHNAYEYMSYNVPQENQIETYPKIQWCCYNKESKDIKNIRGPAFIMFENGDIKRPVCISYSVIGNIDGSSGGTYGPSEPSPDNPNEANPIQPSTGSIDENDIFVNGSGYAWPIPTNQKNYNNITCSYGTPGSWALGYHPGVDIGVPTGSQVVAVTDGKVITADNDKSYGNYIILQHTDGKYSLYAHNSKLLVSSGTTVNRGTPIAISGSTGNSSGPHLHFEMRIENAYKEGAIVNPDYYITRPN